MFHLICGDYQLTWGKMNLGIPPGFGGKTKTCGGSPENFVGKQA